MKALSGFGLVVLLSLALFGGLLSYRALKPVVEGRVQGGACDMQATQCAEICADKFIDLVNEEASANSRRR